MGYKEALQKHLKDLGYSDEQITSILNGIQEPPAISEEDQKKLDGYNRLSSDYENLKRDYYNLDKASKSSQKRVNELLIESQVRTALNGAKVKDVDYALYKLKQSGELILGEDEKVIDLDKRIDALKSETPDNFGSSAKTVVVNKPEKHVVDESVTAPQSLRDALQEMYEEK